jgi:hypothetical protein
MQTQPKIANSLNSIQSQVFLEDQISTIYVISAESIEIYCLTDFPKKLFIQFN